MSTFCMNRVYPREGAPSERGVGLWEYEVPGIGNVMVAVTDKGVALMMPPAALSIAQDLSAIRRDLGEVRDQVRGIKVRGMRK